MSGEGPSGGLTRNYNLIRNRLGGKWLLHARHAYVLHRQNNYSSVWTCSNKRGKKCSGAVKLDNKDDFVAIQCKHDSKCVPNYFKNEVREGVGELFDEVGINYDPVQQIYEKRMVELKKKGPSAEIPEYKSLKTGLYNHRNKILGVEKTSFKQPTEVVIPEKFKTHLLVDYNEDINRIIVFMSPKGWKEIENVQHYLCDGTFDCCPPPFKQIFTIHGEVNDDPQETNIVPILYVLLTNKTKSTYKRMFAKIKEALSGFKPKKFTLDFEVATMSAIEEFFPEAVIHGCFVHFQRSVYRKAKSLGLLDHDETTSYVRMCISLAYLPQNEIDDGWLAIMENSYPTEQFTKFNDYFVDQWLAPDGMIAKWCCYKERHRSTNLVEAWNHRLQRHLGKRPSLLLFYEMITTDIATYDTAQERLIFKATPINRRKRRSILNDKAIAKLTEDYEAKQITITTFLEKNSPIVLIAPNIEPNSN